MIGAMLRELRILWPAWLACVALPLPLLLFWHSPRGRGYALMLFFVAAISTVASSFRRDVAASEMPTLSFSESQRLWRTRILSLLIMLLVAVCAFTLASILFNNPANYGTLAGLRDEGIWWRAFVFDVPRDFAAPLLALGAAAAAICVAPYFVLVTGNSLAAVVFSAALVGCMKLLGCLVVVLIYGWDSDAQGRLGMPWHDPDLLVWLFLIFGAVLSVSCYLLGRQRFLQRTTGSIDLKA